MSDEQDAPPTRAGSAVTPKVYVCFGIGPDGNFFIDCPDDEMVARGLVQFGTFEMDRYYTNKRMKAMLGKAQENAMLDGMMGREKKKIDRRIIG